MIILLYAQLCNSNDYATQTNKTLLEQFIYVYIIFIIIIEIIDNNNTLANILSPIVPTLVNLEDDIV
jgi:hypothetical protein